MSGSGGLASSGGPAGAAHRGPRWIRRLVGTICVGVVAMGAGVAPASGQGGPTELQRVPYESDGNPFHVMDVFVPPGNGPFPGIVVIHGGGWRSGQVGKFTPQAAFIAQHGFVAFAVQYRLAPQSTFPAQLDDVEAAVRYIRSHALQFHVDPAELGALGASAGGQLAALVATVGRGPTDRGARVRAVATWSGPMDLSRAGTFGPHGDQLVEQYLGCAPRQCPDKYRQASAVTYMDPTDPPMFIANSSNEIVPLSQAQEMVEKLRMARIPYRFVRMQGDLHATLYESRQVPGSDQTVFQASLDWLRRYVTTASRPPSPTLSPSPSTAPTGVPTSTRTVGAPAPRAGTPIGLIVVVVLLVAAVVASVAIPLIRRINAR